MELSCEADSVPDPEWKWTLNDDEVCRVISHNRCSKVEADGHHLVINTQGLRTELTLTPGDKDADYGVYKCEANNGIGEAAHAKFSVIKVGRSNSGARAVSFRANEFHDSESSSPSKTITNSWGAAGCNIFGLRFGTN